MALQQTYQPSLDTFNTSRVVLMKQWGEDMGGKGYRHDDVHHPHPHLSYRSRLHQTRLAPPNGFPPVAVNSSGFPMPSVRLDELPTNDLAYSHQPETIPNGSYVPATVSPMSRAYYQRLRDTTLNNRLEGLHEALLQGVPSSANTARGHFGRCGSGWRNMTAYQDYSGHNCMFLDGRSGEREQLYQQVRQQYLNAHLHAVWPEAKRFNTDYDVWPDSKVHDSRPPLLGEAFGIRPPAAIPQFDVRLQKSSGPLNSDSVSFVDMNRLPSAGLRSGRPRSSRSRYTWREITEM